MSEKLNKLVGWLLIIFLFTLPWQTRLIISNGLIDKNYWEYGTISLYASDILLIVIIILQIINWRLKKIETTLSASDLILLIIALFFLMFNLYFSLKPNLSLFHASWLLLALSLFIILRQEVISRTTALLSLVSGAGLSCLVGVWQFITQKTMALSWLGLAQHEAGELGASVVETTAPDGFVERWLRAYGTLDHPNMLGGLAAVAIFFCLYLVLKTEIKNKKDLIVNSTFILLVAGLISSLSRAGMLAASLGLIIYLALALKNNFKFIIKQAAPLLIIGLVIISLFAIPYYYILFPRLAADTRLEKKSTTERIIGYKEAWPIIKQHPVVGSGLGTFGLALQNNQPQENVWFYQPIHNVFVFILAETGILGFLIWLWLMLKKIKTSWQKYPEERLIVIGTIVMLICLASFDHWLMSLHFGILFGAACLGLALKK